jgi:hypothetical protein
MWLPVERAHADHPTGLRWSSRPPCCLRSFAVSVVHWRWASVLPDCGHRFNSLALASGIEVVGRVHCKLSSKTRSACGQCAMSLRRKTRAFLLAYPAMNRASVAFAPCGTARFLCSNLYSVCSKSSLPLLRWMSGLMPGCEISQQASD